MELNKIINELKNHDNSNFQIFYDMTSRHVFFSAFTILKDHGLAEDIMQETYINFLNNIDDFNESKNVFSYLSTIARNLAINHYNKYKKVLTNDIYFVNEKEDDRYYDSDVKKILDLLDSDDEKEIITYHVILEYKFAEIAKIIKKPLGTVLWIYNKAIKKLKERVAEVL